MTQWFLLLLLNPGLAIKILRFEPSSNGEIAYETIDMSTPFPEVFTLCSAFKETVTYDGNSFFTIYGASGKPWMTLSNWAVDQITMWVRVNTFWIRDIPAHLMHSWIHVCIKADTRTGNLSVLVNEGPPSFFTVPQLTHQPPKDLKEKLYVGKIEDHEGTKQFLGEVANFNIFSGLEDVEKLSEKSCGHYGDIINKDTRWKKLGEIKERSEDNWMLCNNHEIYRVSIPAEINWDTATEMCHKLGGSITEPHN